MKKTATKKKTAKKTMATKRPTAAGSPTEAMVVIANGDRAMDEIARDLHAAGFQVGDVLEAIGQVTGHAPANLKSRLKKIRGVQDVTGAHEDFDIGPPGAPVS
ncbi:MAG: hypothetical protein ABI806_25930 [Candidatus Solibacter sp.]